VTTRAVPRFACNLFHSHQCAKIVPNCYVRQGCTIVPVHLVLTRPFCVRSLKVAKDCLIVLQKKTFITLYMTPNENYDCKALLHTHTTQRQLTMKTTPFDPPTLLTARRHIGFVDIPGFTGDGSLDLMPPALRGHPEKSVTEPIMPGPTALKRSQTMSGSIIVVEGSDKPNQAYWLARKIENNIHGVTRIGYRLRHNSKQEFKNANGTWELDIDESCLHPLVTIKLMDTKILDDTESGENHMICYLQIIGNDGDKDTHVDGTNVVATCADRVYVILPYHRDGLLEDYCRMQGNLHESVARFFFRQILQVGA
jgi:serine/threonine protein kinase